MVIFCSIILWFIHDLFIFALSGFSPIYIKFQTKRYWCYGGQLEKQMVHLVIMLELWY